MADYRINKISEEVRRELSEIIRELKDPRIADMTSVVLVNVTRDLRYAKAYISVLGDETQQAKTITALKKAAGFIRREVSKRVQLRYTPEFTFILDDSIQHGAHISELLHHISPSEGEENKNDARENR
ncbi:MAG: 30S ribosome-binding factor RbfA [Firmicutes bacterium]|nr:30S ribosome-binding factor RbfA [Bacillota bacterium]